MRWSEEEENILRTMLRNGKTYKMIAKELPNRSECGVRNKAQLLMENAKDRRQRGRPKTMFDGEIITDDSDFEIELNPAAPTASPEEMYIRGHYQFKDRREIAKKHGIPKYRLNEMIMQFKEADRRRTS